VEFHGLKTHVYCTLPHQHIEDLSFFVAFPHWNGHQCNLFYSATGRQRFRLLYPSATLVPTSTLLQNLQIRAEHTVLAITWQSQKIRLLMWQFRILHHKTALKWRSSRSQGQRSFRADSEFGNASDAVTTQVPSLWKLEVLPLAQKDSVTHTESHCTKWFGLSETEVTSTYPPESTVSHSTTAGTANGRVRLYRLAVSTELWHSAQGS